MTENTNHNSNSDVAVQSKPDNDNAAKYYATRSSPAKNKRLSVKTLELAIDCCQRYINDLEHADLDVHDQVLVMSSRINNISLVTYTYADCFMLFTALHGMHMRSGDENSVCLSNACIVTKRKKDLSRFIYHTKDHLA